MTHVNLFREKQKFVMEAGITKHKELANQINYSLPSVCFIFILVMLVQYAWAGKAVFQVHENGMDIFMGQKEGVLF